MKIRIKDKDKDYEYFKFFFKRCIFCRCWCEEKYEKETNLQKNFFNLKPLCNVYSSNFHNRATYNFFTMIFYIMQNVHFKIRKKKPLYSYLNKIISFKISIRCLWVNFYLNKMHVQLKLGKYIFKTS